MSFITDVIEKLKEVPGSEKMIEQILSLVQDPNEEADPETIMKVMNIIEDGSESGSEEQDQETQPALPQQNESRNEEDEIFKAGIKTVMDILDGRDYKYSHYQKSDDVYVITFNVRYDYCRLNVEVFVEKDPLVCFIRINLPVACDPIYHYVISEHLAKLNRESKRYGTYGINFDDGSVECRYRLRYDDGLGKISFEKILFYSLADADDEYPDISKLAAGKLRNAQKEEVVGKVKKLVDDIES